MSQRKSIRGPYPINISLGSSRVGEAMALSITTLSIDANTKI